MTYSEMAVSENLRKFFQLIAQGEHPPGSLSEMVPKDAPA